MAYNDDGGDGLNLEPGDYTIHVTRFGAGQLNAAVDFTLTVTHGGLVPAIGGGGACDRLDACCGHATISGNVQWSALCRQVDTYRQVPGGGDAQCDAGLQGITTYYTSVPGSPDLPSECQ